MKLLDGVEALAETLAGGSTKSTLFSICDAFADKGPHATLCEFDGRAMTVALPSMYTVL